MLASAAVALVNHVLDGEEWARNRLKASCGQTASVQYAGTTWVVRITEAGLLEPADQDSPPTVSIRLPNDAPLRALSGSMFAATTISGSIDLAETLGFVFRNLRWDVEHDLSLVLGDIVSRRVWQLGRSLGRWQIDSARKLATGIAEYLTEEEHAIARRGDIESFCSAVDGLRDDIARFEKQLESSELRRA